MEHKLWIVRKWVGNQGGRTIGVENSATGKKFAEVVDASATDANRAVQAAKLVFNDGH